MMLNKASGRLPRLGVVFHTDRTRLTRRRVLCTAPVHEAKLDRINRDHKQSFHSRTHGGTRWHKNNRTRSNAPGLDRLVHLELEAESKALMEDFDEEDFLAIEVTNLSELLPSQTLKIVKPSVRPTCIKPQRTYSRRKLHSKKENDDKSKPDKPPSPMQRNDSVFDNTGNQIYSAFREMAPYIALHYNSVAVVHIPGEVLESEMFDQVMHDIILLKTLGMKLVLVIGCRPQIRRVLIDQQINSSFINGNRVCDLETLKHCQSVAGSARVEIEAKLGRGLLNAPMTSSVQVLSGNFVKAIPYGVRGGIDYKYSGIVQNVKANRIHSLLDQGNIVLLGHLGYSHSAQVFHCRSEEVAVTAAADLQADKLIFFHNGENLVDANQNRLVHNLSSKTAQDFTEKLKAELGETGTRINHTDDHPLLEWKVQFLDYLQGAVAAVGRGVERVHLVSRHQPGALITELCTREGSGLMVSYEVYDAIRKASVKDVPALLALIQPLEAKGILVTRPPNELELEADNFYVFERDGAVLACFQYKNYADERYAGGASEMSCVAVSPDIRQDGIGTALLTYFMRKCLLEGVHNAFVLTTQTSHWFEAHGFVETPPQALPPSKYAKYNFSRNPKVYYKTIVDEKQVEQEEMMWGKSKR